MAWDINRVVLVGRLANDVDFRTLSNGTPLAKFGLAVGGRPNQDGSDSVSFFDVAVFGKSAENCSRYLSKGKQVALEGRLQQQRWKAQDGSNRSKVEIVADRVEFLGSAGGGGNQGGGYGQNQNSYGGGNQGGGGFNNGVYDNSDYDSSFDPTPMDSSFGSGNDETPPF